MLIGTARLALHRLGGLAVVRAFNRKRLRVLMFHEFRAETRPRMEQLCTHIARNFEPVSLTQVAGALNGGTPLPSNALAVTVDDGYRNFLEHGHPVFRKHRIPTTVYSVSGFANGELWLWTDHVAFAVEHNQSPSLTMDGKTFDLSSAEKKKYAVEQLWEYLKGVSNAHRLECLRQIAAGSQIPLPEAPPKGRESLSWEEMRTLAREEVEIGCHTYSHPILSRVENRSELEREIAGAKQFMESKLGFAVNHFCYPNGRPADIGQAAEECVRKAGFVSSATCTYSLNGPAADPLKLARVPLDDGMDPIYSQELLAGLHLS